MSRRRAEYLITFLLLAVVLAWRAWAVHENQTLPFLTRLAATTAMTELLADDWFGARRGEVELLNDLLAGGGTHPGAPGRRVEDALARAAEGLRARTGLEGLWLMSAQGERLAGVGEPPLRDSLLRAVTGAVGDSMTVWTEYRDATGSVLVVLAQAGGRADPSDTVSSPLLVALYDPYRELLPLILDVPVPTQGADNTVYIEHGDRIVEVGLRTPRPGPPLPRQRIPAPIRAAFDGIDFIGPAMSLDGQRVHLSARPLDRLGWVLARSAERDFALRQAFWPQFGVEAVTLIAFALGVLVVLASHRRTVRRVQLEAELATSELRRLQLQLQPHFLLNALAGAEALVRTDPPRSGELLARISGFLHSSLRTAGVAEVTLRREMEFLDQYLAIERFRLGASLDVSVDVPTDMADALVPTMVLQPLAENVIRHGYLGPDAVTVIHIAAHRKSTDLVVSIRDNGRGTASPGTGLGLTNLRERLRQLYGPAAGIRIDATPGEGTLVELTLPLHHAGSEA